VENKMMGYLSSSASFRSLTLQNRLPPIQRFFQVTNLTTMLLGARPCAPKTTKIANPRQQHNTWWFSLMARPCVLQWQQKS